MAETVTICEVGPRDGLQIAKGRMPTGVKQRWVAAMAASGLPQIEVGSFVSPKLIPQMADTGEIVRAARALAIPGFTVVALAPNLRGTEAALAAGAQRITVPISVTMGHSRANLNRTPEEQIAEIKLDIDKYKVRGALTWVHVGSHMGTDASAWHCRGRAGRPQASPTMSC